MPSPPADLPLFTTRYAPRPSIILSAAEGIRPAVCPLSRSSSSGVQSSELEVVSFRRCKSKGQCSAPFILATASHGRKNSRRRWAVGHRPAWEGDGALGTAARERAEMELQRVSTAALEGALEQLKGETEFGLRCPFARCCWDFARELGTCSVSDVADHHACSVSEFERDSFSF